ncbi:hypothetical protein [Kitasatospora indigofera]
MTVLQLPLFPGDITAMPAPFQAVAEEPEEFQPIPVLPGQLSLFGDDEL